MCDGHGRKLVGCDVELIGLGVSVVIGFQFKFSTDNSLW